MTFIRKMAVKKYRKNLIEYTDIISGVDDEKKISDLLIFSVWLRSELQIHGVINPLKLADSSYDGIDLEPELHSYPLLLMNFEAYIKKVLKKQKENSKIFALELWVHTLRGIIRPELNSDVRFLWEIIMKSKRYWDETLEKAVDEDTKAGIDKEMVQKNLKLSREILDKLPPKEIYQ